MGNIFKEYLQSIVYVIGWKLINWSGYASYSPTPSHSPSPSYSNTSSPSPSPSEEITDYASYATLRNKDLNNFVKSSPDNDYKSSGGGTAPVQAMVMDGSDHVPRISV